MIRLTELEEKLTYLSQLLDELRAGIPSSLLEYESQPLIKRGCERLVQLTVECAGDICSLATEIGGKPSPYSLYQSFIDASSPGLMPRAIARELAEWTKLATAWSTTTNGLTTPQCTAVCSLYCCNSQSS
jgi:uncharacterized protein YutE (UPF0331/DUF86 family)